MRGCRATAQELEEKEIVVHSLEQRFRTQLTEQASVRAAGRLLAETAAELGWDRAAFIIDKDQTIPARSDKGEFVGVDMGWPAAYIEEWVRQGLCRICPVTQHCARATDSFAWESDPKGMAWEGRALAAEQRRVLEFYRDCADGAVTVPVHRPGGKIGYVSWFMRDGRRLIPKFCETYDATYLISHAFIRHLEHIIRPQERAGACGKPPGMLTARELECLRWAACGRTEEDIGIIIERSRETVHFHLQNAAAKLEACNRTHAVAIACSRGLITVL